MARFDVRPTLGKSDGYVLDVQAGLLAHLATRVVVPLLPEEASPPSISKVNPLFDVKGKRYVMVTQALSAVSSRELKRAILSLEAQHDVVSRALDLLLIGF